MAFAIRTEGPPVLALPAVRAALAEVDPQMPLASPTRWRPDRGVGRPARLAVVLLSLFAGLGLALAATGIYGVMSVRRGAAHAGARRAHGAGRGDAAICCAWSSRGARG
jgi:hypothetical protein